MAVGTKDKLLVRTENSSPVNVSSGRLCIMLLLYWEEYVLMNLVVNLRNEDLHWFSGKILLFIMVCICVLVGV